jgi:hypothetical protein
MMFIAHAKQDDVFLGLPDNVPLEIFPTFERITREKLPDFLSTLVVREDGFEDRFPDIAKKRRSRVR